MAPEDGRSSPDTFLRLIEKSRRGKLKIYIGHAAGVGKTYQMLEDAHAVASRGADVVVGIIETHGRAETAAKLDGLAILARRKVRYKDRDLEEMDLPGILDRKPEIVLVDELAHTNVPGVENEKRYQDVEDILAAGISVMTTVNIQHFESVQEIVSRVTHVEVRERGEDDAFSILLDPALTIETFGWTTSTPLVDGVAKAIAWYRERGVEQTFTHLQMPEVRA